MNEKKQIKQRSNILNASFDFINSKYYQDMLKNAENLRKNITPLAEQNAKLIASLGPSINQINQTINSVNLKALESTILTTHFTQNYIALSATFNKYLFPELNFLSKSIIEWQEKTHFELGDKLKTMGDGYYRPWAGAWQSLEDNNVDKARHCACSMRELMTKILHDFTADIDLKKKYNIPPDKNPTRRQRIETILEKNGHQEGEEKTDLINQVFNALNNLHKPTHNQENQQASDVELKELLTSAELAIDTLILSASQLNSS